jgi:DNA-binding transcriptional LysR family regulator
LADAIYGRLGEALGLVRSSLVESRGFDPTKSERRFVVAIPHPLGPMLALRLLRRMESNAPGVTLEFSTRSRPVDLERGLLDGRIDLAIDWLPPTRAGLTDEEVVRDELAFVARRGHPLASQQKTRKSLVASAQFVSLRQRVDLDAHPLEGVREWLQLKPRVTLQVSEFVEVLMVAAESDLLGAVPRSLAIAGARALDIQVVSVKPRFKPFSIRMVWRGSRSTDHAHKFLREQVRTAMKEAIKI